MSRSVEACVLCGSEISQRHMQLVEWREPIGKEIWSHIPRCVDAAACRERVELLGEAWPLDDDTPPVRRVTAEPLGDGTFQVEVEPEPVDEEVPAWLRD